MEVWRKELYHHGIKGMKWGIRRTPQQLGHKPTRKQYNSEKRNTYTTNYKKMRGKYGVDEAETKAIAYGNKNGVNSDHGLMKDKHYSQMWDRIEYLDAKAVKEAKQYTNRQLLEKYGKETVERFEKQNRRSRIISAGIVTAMAALPVSVLMYQDSKR